ncbi:hypothetical protein EJ05DRAFT_314059 [Pseudovirgaria hyperparasitica]|uniref:Uncharacterized protein n=1 Tax=Pseudovirgaria hyperparasitica TaxID=470096 RepID=A0A6A6WDH1_9PEZI|nr:uncharacterized protein EJ05DRAFT_314059 [Pseudovirgaria hyperparasitica]KAF2759906.1 hypothetical protein EJ05DRAFT_314059 [Pseudovirgaria hyperparasitica]
MTFCRTAAHTMPKTLGISSPAPSGATGTGFMLGQPGHEHQQTVVRIRLSLRWTSEPKGYMQGVPCRSSWKSGLQVRLKVAVIRGGVRRGRVLVVAWLVGLSFLKLQQHPPHHPSAFADRQQPHTYRQVSSGWPAEYFFVEQAFRICSEPDEPDLLRSSSGAPMGIAPLDPNDNNDACFFSLRTLTHISVELASKQNLSFLIDPSHYSSTAKSACCWSIRSSFAADEVKPPP